LLYEVLYTYKYDPRYFQVLEANCSFLNLLQCTRDRENFDASIMQEDFAITAAGPPVPASAPVAPAKPPPAASAPKAAAKPPPSVPASAPEAAAKPPTSVPAAAPEAAAKPPPSVPAAAPEAAAKPLPPPLPRFLGHPMPKPVEDLDATIMQLDSAITGIIPPGHVDVEAEASTVPNSPETSSSLGSLRLSDSDEEARQGSQSGVPEEEAAALNRVII
jgi:hypothetical protein